MIGKWIYAKLTADPQVSALVGTRVRKVRAKQNETRPYVVYKRISNRRAHALDSPDGLPMPLVWIWCYAETGDAAEDLADKVRQALDGKRGLAGGIFVQACLLQDDEDDADPPVHGDETGDPNVLLQFRIAYEETPA
jgi:hypothetical protein